MPRKAYTVIVSKRVAYAVVGYCVSVVRGKQITPACVTITNLATIMLKIIESLLIGKDVKVKLIGPIFALISITSVNLC